MTELDVKLQLENRKKVLALGGDTPYRIILEEIEEEKTKARENSWKTLGAIYDFLKVSDGPGRELLENLPDTNDYAGMRVVLQDYYTLRSERHATFTSFSYTDAIRVFKTADVSDYISKTGNILRTELAKQFTTLVPASFDYDIKAERLRKERIFSWISSDDLNHLLSEPLPQGIGPDDSRLIDEARKILEKETPESSGRSPVVFLLISGDRRLGRAMGTYLKKGFPKLTWSLYQIDQSQYIGLCVADTRRKSDGLPPFEEKNNIRLWNYILKSPMVLPKDVILELRKSARELGGRMFTPKVLLDYPNVERAIEPSHYDPVSRSVVVTHGGFLRAETMRNIPRFTSWAARPIQDISRDADFSTFPVTKYPLEQLRFGSRKFYNKPLSLSSLRNISEWTQETGEALPPI